MENPGPYDTIERMIRHTEEYMRKQVERELSLDGLQKRLSQLSDTLYLGVILASFPVCMYALHNTISEHVREQPPMSERFERIERR